LRRTHVPGIRRTSSPRGLNGAQLVPTLLNPHRLDRSTIATVAVLPAGTTSKGGAPNCPSRARTCSRRWSSALCNRYDDRDPRCSHPAVVRHSEVDLDGRFKGVSGRRRGVSLPSARLGSLCRMAVIIARSRWRTPAQTPVPVAERGPDQSGAGLSELAPACQPVFDCRVSTLELLVQPAGSIAPLHDRTRGNARLPRDPSVRHHHDVRDSCG
jgi:hypothetical protein